MASRVEVVVTFLALLELIRLKQVRAIQARAAGRDRAHVRGGLIRIGMRRVLVAGCGYLGTAVADLFQETGWAVEGWTGSAGSAAQLLGKPYPVIGVDLSPAKPGQRSSGKL